VIASRSFIIRVSVIVCFWGQRQRRRSVMSPIRRARGVRLKQFRCRARCLSLGTAAHLDTHPTHLWRPRKPGATLPHAWGSGGLPRKSLRPFAPSDAGLPFAMGRGCLIPEPSLSKLPGYFKQIEDCPRLAWPLQTSSSQVRERGWARFVSSDHGQSAYASFAAILDQPA
jgi:hypothetical protein